MVVFNNYFLQPRALKSSGYAAKQRDSAANSSADEDFDDASEAAELDEDGENKSEHSAQSVKSKTSSIKKKREVVSFVYLRVL